jgi:hypothetical protein
LNNQSTGQSLQRLRDGNPFNLNPILAFVTDLRVKNAFGPSSLITEQKKALRVSIKSADWINGRRKIEAGQRPMVRPIRGKLRDYAERLVKGDQHTWKEFEMFEKFKEFENEVREI